ncbi:MAG: hypothetical protein WB711_13420 [Terriglobales bacterium]
MKRSYHTISTQGQSNSKRLAEFLSHGQGLLPMVDLIEQSRLAVDELIDVAGRATIEAVLQLSAEQVAGPRTPGQRRRGLLWQGNVDSAVMPDPISHITGRKGVVLTAV